MARAAGPLTQRGKPTRAEIDRGQGKDVAGDALDRSVEVVGAGVQGERWAGRHGCGGLEVHAPRAGLMRDDRAIAAHVVAEAHRPAMLDERRRPIRVPYARAAGRPPRYR